MELSNHSILIAVIGKAQGISGQVRLKHFSESLDSLTEYASFYDNNGIEYKVEDLSFHKNIPIIRFEGINDRTMAEKLAGTELFITRAQLPDSLEEDEFYQADLLGYEAIDENATYIGVVSGFFNFGGGDLLEITLPAALETPHDPAEKQPDEMANVRQAKAKKRRQSKEKKELIPFTKLAVPDIHQAQKQIIVNRLAAGLVPHKSEENIT